MINPSSKKVISKNVVDKEIEDEYIKEVEIKIRLVSPYDLSLNYIYDMISLWGIKVLSSNTKSSIVKISILAKKFKLLFGVSPKIGKYKHPNGTEKFIETTEVTKLVR
jgi:hypothetical protein